MNYIIECNDKQLRAMSIALEEYVRLRLGQMGDLAEDLSMLNYQNLSADERHERFNEILQIRDHTRLCLDVAYRMATADRRSYGLPSIGRTPTSRICEDAWQVFRHQLWLDAGGPEKMPWSVDGNSPLCVSDEPLVRVRRDKDDL
jgi:hypothetical protein